MTFMRKILDALNMNNWRNTTKSISILSEDERLDYIASGKPFDLHFDNSNQIIPEDLYSIYNGTLPKRKEEQIATDILSSVGMFKTPTNMSTEAQKYLSFNHSRIETCVYGAQICIPPQNNNELYIISCAYHWAGAAYRKEAIYWSEKYIAHGAVSDYIQSYLIHSPNYSYDQRIKFVAIAHSVLAGLYAEEKQFDKSNNEYRIAIEIAPYLSSNYIKLAQNYIKLREFSNVDRLMFEAQNSIFYSLDNIFKENIDRHKIQFKQEIDKIKYYINTVIPKVLQRVSENPGILQKSLYTMFPDIDQQHIRWVCKYLEQEKKLLRTKNGNSYALFIDSEYE